MNRGPEKTPPPEVPRIHRQLIRCVTYLVPEESPEASVPDDSLEPMITQGVVIQHEKYEIPPTQMFGQENIKHVSASIITDRATGNKTYSLELREEITDAPVAELITSSKGYETTIKGTADFIKKHVSGKPFSELDQQERLALFTSYSSVFSALRAHGVTRPEESRNLLSSYNTLPKNERIEVGFINLIDSLTLNISSLESERESQEYAYSTEYLLSQPVPVSPDSAITAGRIRATTKQGLGSATYVLSLWIGTEKESPTPDITYITETERRLYIIVSGDYLNTSVFEQMPVSERDAVLNSFEYLIAEVSRLRDEDSLREVDTS